MQRTANSTNHEKSNAGGYKYNNEISLRLKMVKKNLEFNLKLYLSRNPFPFTNLSLTKNWRGYFHNHMVAWGYLSLWYAPTQSFPLASGVE